MKQNKQNPEIDFEELYNKTRHYYYSYFLSRLRDPVAAEDLMQELFAKAIHSQNQLRDPEKVLPWMNRIAGSVLADYCKSKSYKCTFSMDPKTMTDAMFKDNPDSHSNSPVEAEVIKEEEAVILRKALKHLAQDEQLFLHMRYFEHLTFTQIAEILHLPLGTVKNRVIRSYAKCEKILAAMEKGKYNDEE